MLPYNRTVALQHSNRVQQYQEAQEAQGFVVLTLITFQFHKTCKTMLDDEEELAVSEEDFSMTSEPEEEEEKQLTLGQLILQNKAIQQEVQAKLALKKLENSVPDRITKLPPHSHAKHMLKTLWKDHVRLLNLSHYLHDCDCSGNQTVESKLVQDFEDRHATYLANEERLRQEKEAAKARAQARKEKRAAGSSNSDSDFGSDSEFNSDNDDEDASYNSGQTKSTARDSELNSEAAGEFKDKDAEEKDEKNIDVGDEGEEGHRDSDDDIEPPPDIPPITLAFVCNVIRDKKRLEGVQLDENPLGPKGTIELCKTLTTVSNLTMLNLSAVNAGLSGARALGDALRCSNLQRTMIHLIFGYNDIGPEGVQEIVVAVGRRCRSLETLRLHNNSIKSDGALIVARELLQCKALQVLDLGGNEIGDRGIEMIADYIGENSALKRVNLQNNLFTQRGAHSLIHMMHLIRQFPKGERLQRLSVVRCRRLKDETKTEMKEAAEHLDDFRLML